MSENEIEHAFDVVWVPNNHGYPYRAKCACGWQSNTYAAKHAAEGMGEWHVAEEAREQDLRDEREVLARLTK